ncbi:MAG TPA: ABC transporter substrate-binding protein [Stellaceae bacterium]|nr:ABC transporter substrate-binding protein [Stellaceae bacterium]
MTVSISRRDALGGLGGTLALLGAPMAARAADLVQLHVSIVPIFDVAPLFAATAEGYLAAEGLAVSTQAVQGGVVGIPGLVSGAYDICYTNSISVIVALERGIDLRIIALGAPIGDKPPDPGAVLRRKGDPYRTSKDLEGKTIGVNSRKDIMWLVARSWVKATGGDPDKVDYREVPVPQALDALKSKQVDAAIVLEPFLTIGLADPALEFVGWPFNTVLPGMRTAFWVVTGPMADARTATVQGFVRAFRKGVAWVNANIGKEPYFKLVSGYTRIDPNLMQKIHVPQEVAGVDLGPIKELKALMRENGLLNADVDVEAKVFKTG